MNFTSIDALTVTGDVYLGDGPNISGVNWNPSSFQFRKTISVATPATNFAIWTIPINTSFVVTHAQSRTDTIITATTGDFISIGVNAANRRVDYGVNTTAASSSQHAKNSKHRFINSSEVTNQMADSAEVISLMSVTSLTDGAILASNIGGAAETITARIAGHLIGDMVNTP